MTKKVGIPKKKKIINLTKEMQEKYAGLIKNFKDRVMFRCSVETKYLASWNCGILKDARRHLIKDANIVWLYGVGLNMEGTDVEVVATAEMTIMELMALRKAVDDTIELYETKVKGKLSTLQEEGKRQKAKADRLMDFKIEK